METLPGLRVRHLMALCLGEDLSPVPPRRQDPGISPSLPSSAPPRNPGVIDLLRTTFSRTPDGICHFPAHRLQDPVVSAGPPQGHGLALLQGS